MDWKSQSEKIDQLVAAMIKARDGFGRYAATKRNTHFSSSYPELGDVLDSCIPALATEGVLVIQRPLPGEGDRIDLETILIHSSGQFLSGILSLRPGRQGPQDLCACVTYARRYSLEAMLGLRARDDDGNTAQGYRNQQQPRNMMRTGNGRSQGPRRTAEDDINEGFARDSRDLAAKFQARFDNATSTEALAIIAREIRPDNLLPEHLEATRESYRRRLEELKNVTR